MAVVSVVLLAGALFVSTNIDDIFVLVAFFADARFRARDIVLGQLAGIAVLTIGSFALSLAALAIPPHWIGYLGLLPAALGVRMTWRFFRRKKEEEEEGIATTSKSGILAVAAVTLANGADNVAAYVPFFASRKFWESAIVAVVFAMLTGGWCVAAHRLVHQKTLGAPLRKYGGAVLPFVLIALGIYIFVDAGTLR